MGEPQKPREYAERKAEFRTDSGIVHERVYTGLQPKDDGAKVEVPGEFPFTRGIYPTMYRGRLWTMRQYSGFGSPRETNQRFKTLMENGETGLSVAFDLPTQLGYDSDDPLSFGEVGRVGVFINSLKDMEELFDGIPLDKVSTSMTINAPAAIILCMYISVASKGGIRLDTLSGTVQNDILKEYVARGTYIFPPVPSLRLTTDLIEFCAHNLPKWNPISISGYHMREAGASAPQEIAFTFANAMEYIRAAASRGMAVDDFAPRLAFFFSSGMDLLEEVAKFRAARRLWANIMADRFGATNPKSCALRFHAQTAGSALTAQQPLNNIVRVTIQALAAAFGGAQSIHTNAMDEALDLPTEESATLALRTQQIIASESGITGTVDPMGGSFCIETLTDRMEERALEYLDRVERMGGALKAIETGYIQNEIHENAFRVQEQIESGERTVIGVNAFRGDGSPRRPSSTPGGMPHRDVVSRLVSLRERRDNARVQETLEELKVAAASDKNLVPLILECVRAYATVGEICGCLRSVFGEYVQR